MGVKSVASPGMSADAGASEEGLASTGVAASLVAGRCATTAGRRSSGQRGQKGELQSVLQVSFSRIGHSRDATANVHVTGTKTRLLVIVAMNRNRDNVAGECTTHLPNPANIHLCIQVKQMLAGGYSTVCWAIAK